MITKYILTDIIYAFHVPISNSLILGGGRGRKTHSEHKIYLIEQWQILR